MQRGETRSGVRILWWCSSLAIGLRHSCGRRGREEGASAVEYAIIVAAVAALIIAVVAVIGAKTQGLFDEVRDAMTDGGL
jgi:pilus assembly protein Flp/PilA